MRRLAAAIGACLSLVGAAKAQTPALAHPAPTPQMAGFNAERLRAIDALMQREIDTGQIAGSVVMLVRHGKTILFNAHGRRDLDSPDPMPRDALFRIRSETKPVTGVAMMMLYEQGLWGLDDPVTKYVPEFSNLKVIAGADTAGQPILEPISRSPTMRELMTHTAGFAYGLAADGPADTAYLNAGVLTSSSAAEMIGKIATLPMVAQPGVKWRYSAATDIQGYIVEKLSGQTLAQFMGERIFAPLGMTDSGFYVQPAKIGRLAGFYDADPVTGKLIRAPERGGDITVEPGLASGGGGLISTAQDLSRFAQMILNNGELNGQRLLKPETVALMRTNHLPESFMVMSNGTRASPLGTGVGFGLDWAVWMDPKATGAPVGAGTISWGGSAGTWFWIDPKNDLYFIGMIQRQGGTGGGLDAATRSLTYQALVDPAQ
jgi:CubicO group peptidase (beta-lactamase class C family)